jgi:hypothetical protein
MPKGFAQGEHYKELRKSIYDTFANIEVVGLPENIFRHSGILVPHFLKRNHALSAISPSVANPIRRISHIKEEPGDKNPSIINFIIILNSFILSLLS